MKHETRHEYEQRIEIADLKATVLRLRARAAEDIAHEQYKVEQPVNP